jgi:hypothetical protein
MKYFSIGIHYYYGDRRYTRNNNDWFHLEY